MFYRYGILRTQVNLYGHMLACINSPVETVLAGKSEAMSTLKTTLTEERIKSILLKVPYSFHSSQIEPVMAEFKNLASGVTFSAPKMPVLCP